MKAVEVMGTLLGNNGVEGEMEDDSIAPLEDVEEQELELSATNVINVVDVPGQGGKIVGDFPSVLNFLPDNMPRSMSLRLAQAKRNTVK